MRKEIRLMGLLTVITFALGMPHALAGNNQPADKQAAPEGGASPTMDEAKINKFVDVYSDVQMVQQKYTQQLQTATNQEDARALQEKAQVEMVEVVEENGISVEEYNQMVQTVTSNPNLMARVEEKMEN